MPISTVNLTPLLVAHRGLQQHYPENSLQAVEKAIAAGAQHIEVDVQLTAQKDVVVCHDIELTRLTGQAQSLHALNAQALAQLSLHEPARLGETFKPTPLLHLSTLLTYIAQHPTVTLYIEIKQESIDAFSLPVFAEAVMALVLNSPALAQCHIISFSVACLDYIDQHFDFKRLVPVLNHWQEWQQLSFTPTLLFSNTHLLPNLAAIKTCPIPLAFYEVSTKQEATTLLTAGAALIETFNFESLSQ